MPSSRLDPSRLEISLLTEADGPLPAFSCGDDDLDAFLRDDAIGLQADNVTRVYLAWYRIEFQDASALVGYAALVASTIELATREKKRCNLQGLHYKLIPAVKLGRLAVSTQFKQVFSGCGTVLVREAVKSAWDAQEIIGCRLLTVDAYRSSVEFYKKLGFSWRHSEENDPGKETVTMWLDLDAESTDTFVSQDPGARNAQAP